MTRLVQHADRYNSGMSIGRSFVFVWGYMTTSGYGELDDYAGGRSSGGAQHVQAARMLADDDGPARREIEYVMTTRGPEPIEKRAAPIDHGHYIDKQLAPACDVVLPFVGTSFARVAGAQTSLF